MKKWIYVGAAVLALVVGGYLLIPGQPPLPVLPVPNGYDDLMKAAGLAVTREHRCFGESTDDELRDLVNANGTALELARNGLKHTSRVTTDYRLAPAVYSAQHMPVLASMKSLALAFRAEGEFAERQRRTNEAARIYLDGIRFGQEVCRGGLLIDRLVGIACERMSSDRLLALVTSLDSATSRDLARTLEAMESKREPVQATLDEERRWAYRTGGIRERIVMRLRPKALEAARQNAADKIAEIELRERRLMLQLAARAYQLDRGNPPGAAADLTPEYLRAIPKHPVTKGELTL